MIGGTENTALGAPDTASTKEMLAGLAASLSSASQSLAAVGE